VLSAGGALCTFSAVLIFEAYYRIAVGTVKLDCHVLYFILFYFLMNILQQIAGPDNFYTLPGKMATIVPMVQAYRTHRDYQYNLDGKIQQ